ncbi:MAG: nucleoside triphosphate pyrophosphohydrolase [Flavobacteriales bacterium]|nr:nucleoside triphosphate pyrophosphohydrolase [Flavobacteriales bacterium]
MKDKLKEFERLLNIMDELREKCPWDMKQTIESIRYLTIEETYELSDAIMNNDMEEIKKELGDVLLHIVFYSRIASETNEFDIKDVMASLCEKLIRRHPHIYGDVKVTSEEDVKRNWEKIKQTEGKKKTSVLSGVPKSMPSLIKATRIQEKARGVGFDWDRKEDVWSKVEEELGEFKAELNAEVVDRDKVEGEFGDLLFSLINYARFLDIDPDTALERTNNKFIGRFDYMEKGIKNDGKEITKLSLSEMDVYWEKAKEML